MEMRTFSAMSLRAKGKTIVGLVPFNSPSEDLGGWIEILKPGCFAETLASGRDIKSFWNHDTGKVLGSTKAGTLQLEERSNGLRIQLIPPNNSWGADALESVRRGDTDGFSFGFATKEGGEQWTGNTRELTNVELYEVSPTAMPAFTGSQAMVRSGRSNKKMEQEIVRPEDMNIQELEHLLEQKRKFAAMMPDPSDGTQQQERHNTEFRSAGEFFQAVMLAGMPGGEVDPRLTRAATGLNEAVGSQGGFLLQDQYRDEIWEKVYITGAIIPRCAEQNMKSNSLKIPYVDETSRATGSRHGGVRAYWVDEAGEKTASKPKFGRMELNLKKCVVLIYATDELLDDAQALEAYIKRVAPDEIAFTIEDAIINGTGAGQPLGIINSNCMVSVGAETGQAATTFLYENAVKMWSRMYGASRKNAVWLINQDVEPQLYSMSLAVGTGGSPVFLPGGGASDAPYASLFGRPVIPVEYCPTLGTTGDVILADFNQYVLARKALQTAMSIHVRFIYDESVFRFVVRVDGQPAWSSALTPYKGGSNTQSPFVKLDSRT
jgi:HK97 family phage major capsid protein/HK97 family phage prohead protease